MRPVEVLIASSLAVLSACSSDGPDAALHRFPIGLLSVSDAAHLRGLKDDGFDSFLAVGKDLEALAREARRLGLRMLLQPSAFPGEAAARTAGWPVDAWYLPEEPEVNRQSPESAEEGSAELRQRDPAHPQALLIGAGSAAAKYGKIADVLMLDWYPVPHLKLDSVAEQMDLARRSLPPGKPLWMVLQAMDWRDYPQGDPKKPRIGRFPDFAEIRFMSYLAIVHGASGLFYFNFQRPGGKTLLDFPEEWQAVTRVVEELKSLQPMLERGSRIDLPFSPLPGGPEALAWRWHARDYVVILNRKKGVMQKMPDELLKPEWRPLFETRRDPRELLEPSDGAWYLLPYQVMVLESRLRLPWGRRLAAW